MKFIALILGLTLLHGAAAHAALPLLGCYERMYDATHLAAHKGQLATRVTLAVKKATDRGKQDPPLDGNLEIRVKGSKLTFDSAGACWPKGGGLTCNGSDSASEADECASKGDGVRDCRITLSDVGRFLVTPRREGVLVTIATRLELSSGDAPPFLYLSDSDKENSAFLLMAAPTSACK